MFRYIATVYEGGREVYSVGTNLKSDIAEVFYKFGPYAAIRIWENNKRLSYNEIYKNFCPDRIKKNTTYKRKGVKNNGNNSETHNNSR